MGSFITLKQALDLDYKTTTKLAIRLANDQIDQKIQVFTNLYEIHLQANKLQFIPDWLIDLASLKKLYVYNSSLQELNPIIFSSNLETIWIKNSQIRQIKIGIQQNNQLKVLKINNSQLKAIPSGIDQLTALEELDLGANQIEQMSFELLNLNQIKRINLENNLIKKLDFDPSMIKSLLHINLDQNPLDEASQNLIHRK
jgi:Leucine-rich repeat (LRR) protein